jgi:hypothetical protein
MNNRTYIGKVVEDGTIGSSDPLGLGRRKVFVPEVHPLDIDAQSCPWAMVTSTTASGLEGQGQSSVALRIGAQVLVIFLDEYKQHPVIIGSIPYIQDVAKSYELAGADRNAMIQNGPGSVGGGYEAQWQPLKDDDIVGSKIGEFRVWQEMVNRFVAEGMGEYRAKIMTAGFVGNIKLESNFNLSATNSIGCRGLIQWCYDRKRNLNAYSSAKGWTSFEVQLNFIFHELKTSHSRAFDKIKTANTAAEAAAIIDVWYEISEGTFTRSSFKTSSQKSGFNGKGINKGGQWWYENENHTFRKFANSNQGKYLGMTTQKRIENAVAAYNTFKNEPIPGLDGSVR